MGLALKGTAYESRYLIADIEVEGAARPVERNVWFDSPANPGSTVILHVQPDDVWRIDYQLRDDEDLRRGAARRKRAGAAAGAARHDGRARARGESSGKASTRRLPYRSTITGTAACCSRAMPLTLCRSSGCAA